MSPGIPQTRSRLLPITSIRQDGHTQHRATLNVDVVREYAALMSSGVQFPPVNVWWDGEHYWLADGYHRISAARLAAIESIIAEVHSGSLSEAQWDSYAANTRHGLRWTPSETKRVVQLALQHPNANNLSNVELARHLNLSENTVRRWRTRLSSLGGEDGSLRIRIVTRGKSTYQLPTANIGRSRRTSPPKQRSTIRSDLKGMKVKASPQARRVLNVIGNWIVGGACPTECLEALERILGA